MFYNLFLLFAKICFQNINCKTCSFYDDILARALQEDDGLGGRRRKKKGITEKIKEKLPGHHGSLQTATTTVYDTTGTGVHHEKKGMMEKIKEKLPGGH